MERRSLVRHDGNSADAERRAELEFGAPVPGKCGCGGKTPLGRRGMGVRPHLTEGVARRHSVNNNANSQEKLIILSQVFFGTQRAKTRMSYVNAKEILTEASVPNPGGSQLGIPGSGYFPGAKISP